MLVSGMTENERIKLLMPILNRKLDNFAFFFVKLLSPMKPRNSNYIMKPHSCVQIPIPGSTISSEISVRYNISMSGAIMSKSLKYSNSYLYHTNHTDIFCAC